MQFGDVARVEHYVQLLVAFLDGEVRDDGLALGLIDGARERVRGFLIEVHDLLDRRLELLVRAVDFLLYLIEMVLRECLEMVGDDGVC